MGPGINASEHWYWSRKNIVGMLILYYSRGPTMQAFLQKRGRSHHQFQTRREARSVLRQLQSNTKRSGLVNQRMVMTGMKH